MYGLNESVFRVDYRIEKMAQPALFGKLTEWALRPFAARRTIRNSTAVAILLAIMALIGLLDFASGIYVSLMVFYFVPVALAVGWFGWRAAVAVAGGSVVIRLVGDYFANGQAWLPFWNVWNSLSVFATFLIAIWLLSAFFTLRRQLEQRVAIRTAELLAESHARKRLEEALLAVNSRERMALGQELHDEVCQELVGTAMAAQVLAQQLSEQGHAHDRDALKIVGLIESTADKARRLARGLLHSEVSPDGLAEKLAEMTDEIVVGGLICRFSAQGNTQVDTGEVATHLFRIAQEAARNTIKHAQARQLDVSLVGTRSELTLQIQDDGIGFVSPPAPNDGMGLAVMANRAKLIGANLTIDQTRPGTQVKCVWPRASTGGAA